MSRKAKILLGIAIGFVALIGFAVFAYWKLGEAPAPEPVPVADTVHAAKPPADSEDVEGAKSLLRDLMAAEDLFVADSTRFTDDVQQLVLARGDTTRVFVNPPGFSGLTLTASGEGWTASISSAHHKCGVVIGQIPNPVEPTAAEREPVCVSK